MAGKTKTVWMVSGNKGGVGKSLFCLALASALEVRRESYAVFDGDGRTGDVFATFLRKVPAVLGDFRNLRPGDPNNHEYITYAESIEEFLGASDHLIVNTPDGADSVLLKWFDVSLKVTETNNHLFKMMYLLSDRPDGLNMLPDMIQRFAFLYPVRNLYFGASNLFSHFNTTYGMRFDDVLDFPVLRSEEVRMLFDLKTYPAEVLRLKNCRGNFSLPALVRARIERWQIEVDERISDVIDNDAVSNIKPIIE